MAFAVMGAGLSADRPPTDPTDEVGLVVQRPDMSDAAFALRVDRNCLESVEGRWPKYQSVTLDGLCVIDKSKVRSISSMRIVLFGLAARDERPQSVRIAAANFYDGAVSAKLIAGYEANGRLLTYSDDVGQPLALGTFSLEAHNNDALLSFVACDTYWRGGGGHMLSLMAARCHSHGTIEGIRLFVAFDLVAPISKPALERALTLALRQMAVAEHPVRLDIPRSTRLRER